MDEKRFCKFCGVHLFEDVKFCTNCGTIVTKSSKQPAEPNRYWSDGTSLCNKFCKRRAKRHSYKTIAGAAVWIMILMFFAAGASANSTVSQNSVVQSSLPFTAEALTKAIATTTDTPVNYSAQISAKYKVPFYKTTVNGREAYVGDVTNETNKSIVVHIIIYPTDTLKDARNYKEQLIQSYKAQSYTMHKVTDDYWSAMLLDKNNHLNMHVIGAMDTEWGFPATVDESTTIG